MHAQGRSTAAGKRGRTHDIVVAPAERRDAVLSVINAAKKRLILSVFRCDDFAVLDALADALKRKVSVEILFTPRAKGWERRLKELWDLFEGMGATLHRYADPVVKYHGKYIVADSGTAIVTSLNLTRKCFTSTVDFLVVTRERAVASALTALFDADRTDPGGPLPRGLSRRLIVGPEHAREQFTALIEEARRSIVLIDPKVTDPGMVALLKARKADGVKVRVFGRRPMDGLNPHGKLLIVDNKTAVVGSMSLSALSLEFRREVAIRVDDPPSVRKLSAYVRRLAPRRATGSPRR